MTKSELRRTPAGHYMCGLANWHPAWLQRYANTKSFMLVYGLLGTIQAMSYMYFVVTLTTLEKRFKIPSQTTGIILSGNEISQILLSLILSYIGGQRNRPRWIAWGIVFCGLSCYILALPHFIYGAGADVLQFTKEYNKDWQQLLANGTLSMINGTHIQQQGKTEQLCGEAKLKQECDTLFSIVPLLLIFLSQFVLGVGNTLYYSLGQTYLDDNTKKSNTPLMLAVAMALRMVGPIVGFFLGYLSLNMFIEPGATPLIDNKDPRWLGAWWFGWMILGTLMVLFSGLIGLFPKELPKQRARNKYNSHMPQVLRNDQPKINDDLPLGSVFSSTMALDNAPSAATAASPIEFPKLQEFSSALMRLLRNKLLIYNIISAVFYILGAAGYMTFLTKYMEVQFHKTAQSATIVVGPLSITGMVIGLIGSGLVISKKKPSPSKVLAWNCIVGTIGMLGQVSYVFMYCPDSISIAHMGQLNLSATCNANCACDDVAYSPICHEISDKTYFSPCHAGCTNWNAEAKLYTNCSCLNADLEQHMTTTDGILPSLLQTKSVTTTTNTNPTTIINDNVQDNWTETFTITLPAVTSDIETDATTLDLLTRNERALADALTTTLRPGVCLRGCNIAFWTFSITSLISSWFGSSGRVGNVLVNYRAVSKKDKSFAQGLTLMMISLFALIPGPIIFGRIIDSTCLIWSETCNGKGNCQLYDQSRFRYSVNFIACAFTSIGVLFDILVWYYGRNLDLYGDKEMERLQATERRNQPITPLLAKGS